MTIDETGCKTESFQRRLNETREQIQTQMHRSQEAIREEVTATQKLVLEQSITQQILENQIAAQREWQ